MTRNLTLASIKFIIVDLIGDVLYWPIWWYSKGLSATGLFCIKGVIDQAEKLGVAIWMRNLFTPMFGQYDIEGRIISFFVRLIQIIFRTVMLLVWMVIFGMVFLLWLTLPVLIIYQLARNTQLIFLGL